MGMFLVISSASHACMCMTLSLEEEYEKATYVFQAVITAVETVGFEETGLIGFDKLREEMGEDSANRFINSKALESIKVSFEVIQEFKGEATELKHLYAFKGDRFCGLVIPIDAISVIIVGQTGHVSGCGPSWFGSEHRLGFTIDQVEDLSVKYKKEHNKPLNTDAGDAGTG